jgi:class 3 adenylate cyclase
MAMDIENSTARPNSVKAQSRHVMYEMVEESFRVGGIARRHRDILRDRGDGILALVHPVDQAPTALLLNPVVPTLSRLLADYNAHDPDHQFRLRVVVHAGEVLYDNRDCFGEDLDITFRLLNARKVKRRLRETKEPLVLVVSDYIYQSIIRHCYDGIDEKAFEPLVRVRVAGRQHRGWLYVPDRAQLPDLQEGQ